LVKRQEIPFSDQCSESKACSSHEQGSPHPLPGFIPSHSARAHFQFANDLLSAIVGPGHVWLPIEDPVTLPVLAQTDQHIAQLLQWRAFASLSNSAFRDLLPELKQAATAFWWQFSQ
jgi:hypothetical protein